jgi:hypothetical protein
MALLLVHMSAFKVVFSETTYTRVFFKKSILTVFLKFLVIYLFF